MSATCAAGGAYGFELILLPCLATGVTLAELLREQRTGLLGPEQRVHVGRANESRRQISERYMIPGCALVGACALECLPQISLSRDQRAGNGRRQRQLLDNLLSRHADHRIEQ